MVLLGVDAEVLRAMLPAENGLIVDPALPLRGALPLAGTQWFSHAGVEQIIEDKERGLGGGYLPVDDPPWTVWAEENQ